MLLKTKGVILRFVKYKETSIIATVYTEKEGLVSVIANSVRSKNSKGKIALYQPISLVELVLYFNNTKNINRIAEIRSYHPLHQLRQDPFKSAITIFITEILNKCLKEEIGNPSLYNFIEESIIILNDQSEQVHNFHLIFLIRFSLYLGFKPVSTSDFVDHISNKSFHSDAKMNKIISDLISANIETHLAITSQIRQTLLADLLEYYQNHLDLGKVKSVEILHELLHS